MVKLFIYLLLFGVVLYILSAWGKRPGGTPMPNPLAQDKPRQLLRAKPHPREVWFQVYQTETIDEARSLQARIQEEEVECIIYEQGKKDIHGNELKGIGIAVPKTASRIAQNIIARH